MKKFVLFILSICFILIGSISINKSEEKNEAQDMAHFKIICSPDLYELTTDLTNQCAKTSPGFDIQVVKSQDPVNDLNNAEDNLIFVSQQDLRKSPDNFQLLLLARDVYVPVMSSNNPYIESLQNKGLSKSQLIESINKNGDVQWKSVFPSAGNELLSVFVSNKKGVKEKVMQFLGSTSGTIEQKDFESPGAILSFLTDNPCSIVFCKLTDIIDRQTQSFIDGAVPLPIDKNGNGKIDYIENFNGSADELLRAIWLKKYPQELCTNIYSLTKQHPDKNQAAFLEWVLLSGQQYITDNGLCKLHLNESQIKLAQLHQPQPSVEVADTSYAIPGILLVIVIIAIVGLVVFFLIAPARKKSISEETVVLQKGGTISPENLAIPQGVYFDKTHTWAFMEKDGQVRIGLDNFIQNITGQINQVTLKNAGDTVKKGEALVTLAKDGKKLTLYSPVSGKIKINNAGLKSHPETLNTEPFQNGWLYLIEPMNWARELEFLKMADNYATWIKEEVVRLKDFFAHFVKPTELQGIPAFQDGGEIQEGILSTMPPQHWEEFQSNFIDSLR